MRLYHWKAPAGNFGDDLNPWLWEQLIPELSELGDDTVVFSGVGSSLHELLPKGSVNVLLGPGAGYDSIPRRNYQIYALRGQLTARAMKAPADIPLGDPAVLISRLYQPKIAASDRPPVVFVPHWTTMELGGWEEPCQRSGCVLVDPRTEYLSVFDLIASARLVIAESMHAAIIADAFRVPWIPVVCTHRMDFKWRDWLSPLRLDYEPHMLGAPELQWLALTSQDQSREVGGELVLKHPGVIESWRRRVRWQYSGLMLKYFRCFRERVLDARTQSLSSLLGNQIGVLSNSVLLNECQDSLLVACDRLRADWSRPSGPASV